jgi:RsiW-degrading membrane proteinase PrsW (M82 family)
MTTVTLHYLCRNCGTRFRITAVGWAVTGAVVAIQVLWFMMYRWRAIPWHVTIGMLLVTCSLAIWFLPHLTPVRRGRQASEMKTKPLN